MKVTSVVESLQILADATDFNVQTQLPLLFILPLSAISSQHGGHTHVHTHYRIIAVCIHRKTTSDDTNTSLKTCLTCTQVHVDLRDT